MTKGDHSVNGAGGWCDNPAHGAFDHALNKECVSPVSNDEYDALCVAILDRMAKAELCSSEGACEVEYRP